MKNFLLVIPIFFAIVTFVSCESNEGAVNLPEATDVAENTKATDENLDNQENLVENNTEPLTLGAFSILEGRYGFPGDMSNAITLEEAANIGGQYVLDIFDNNLDGKYMELTFNYNPHISQSTWIGNIGEAAEDFVGEAEGFHAALIVFTLDAFTGERLSIDNLELTFFETADQSDIWSMSDDELLVSFPAPDNNEIEILSTLALDFAVRHFDSDSVTVELGFYPEGEVGFVYFPFPIITFLAINTTTDQVVEISIEREFRELSSIRVPMERLMR